MFPFRPFSGKVYVLKILYSFLTTDYFFLDYSHCAVCYQRVKFKNQLIKARGVYTLRHHPMRREVYNIEARCVSGLVKVAPVCCFELIARNIEQVECTGTNFNIINLGVTQRRAGGVNEQPQTTILITALYFQVDFNFPGFIEISNRITELMTAKNSGSVYACILRGAIVR